MPSHKVHLLIDRIVLGREYPHVHKWKDKPAARLGWAHRKERHNFWANLVLAILSRRPVEVFISATLHDLADRLL